MPIHSCGPRHQFSTFTFTHEQEAVFAPRVLPVVGRHCRPIGGLALARVYAVPRRRLGDAHERQIVAGGELWRGKRGAACRASGYGAGIARKPRDREVDNIVYFLFLLTSLVFPGTGSDTPIWVSLMQTGVRGRR